MWGTPVGTWWGHPHEWIFKLLNVQWRLAQRSIKNKVSWTEERKHLWASGWGRMGVWILDINDWCFNKSLVWAFKLNLQRSRRRQTRGVNDVFVMCDGYVPVYWLVSICSKTLFKLSHSSKCDVLLINRNHRQICSTYAVMVVGGMETQNSHHLKLFWQICQ